MAKSVVNRLRAASYSRYSTWVKCPLLAKYKYILKYPEPDSPAAARGTQIHKQAEDYANGKLKTLPSVLKPFQKELNKLKKAAVHTTEANWAFDLEWNPVSWFDPTVYMRIKADATRIDGTSLLVDDYKTGRIYPDHNEQAQLYTVGGNLWYPLEKFPKVKKIIARLLYIDQRQIVEEEFTRDEAIQLQREWDNKLVPYFKERRFAAKPGNACGRCHFRKTNGGPCRHG